MLLNGLSQPVKDRVGCHRQISHAGRATARQAGGGSHCGGGGAVSVRKTGLASVRTRDEGDSIEGIGAVAIVRHETGCVCEARWFARMVIVGGMGSQAAR